MTRPFRITGRHVLFAMFGFFLVIIGVNAVFITLAIKSFPGEQEKKSYLQGLHYNDRLKAREVQGLLGWNAEITKAYLADGRAVIEIAFSDKDAAPIYDLAITGVLSRSVDDDQDQALVFSAAGAGRYFSEADNIGSGVWMLKVEAVSIRNEIFEFETKLYLE